MVLPPDSIYGYIHKATNQKSKNARITQDLAL
jgi:hypothetical protein